MGNVSAHVNTSNTVVNTYNKQSIETVNICWLPTY